MRQRPTGNKVHARGGNFGQAAGPLLAAFVIVPLGQRGIVWFAALALLAILVLAAVGRWVAEIHARPAVQRGRIVNTQRMPERHSAADFDAVAEPAEA